MLRDLAKCAIFSLLLSGCRGAEVPDSSVCSKPTPISEFTKDTTSEEKAMSCIQNWAYRLRSSQDSSQILSTAVNANCQDRINEWVSTESTSYIDILVKSGYKPIDAVAEAERATVNRRSEIKDLILFTVIQGRVGRCQASD